MVSLSYTDINVPGQTVSYKKISLTPESYSNYFLISYILLKAQIKARPNPSIFSNYDSNINCFINLALSSCTSVDSSNSINYFKSLYDTLKNERDYNQMISFLDYYVGNQDCLNQMLHAGYEFFQVLVMENNGDIDTIIKSEITKIIEYMVSKFSFSIDLFWSTSSYTYPSPSSQPSLKFSIFYEIASSSSPTLSILIPSDESLCEPDPSQSPEIPSTSSAPVNFSPSPSPSLSLSPSPSSKFQVFSSDYPKLLSLLTVLLKSVTEHKLYSNQIDSALHLAIQEDPILSKINSIQNIFHNKRATCDKHWDSQFIQASCGLEHCAECIYSKIKEEFSKPALESVYCPCKIMIPVKFLVEVRKSDGFKDFMKKK